jgi:hypothetical protein
MAKTQVMLAEFDTSAAIIEAARQVHAAGYRRFDAHTPFPVHGLDRAMHLPHSKLGWIVLFHGLVGLVGAYLLQMWTMSVDYPLIIGGKPYNSYQAWVVICFELTVLLSAFGCVFGMLALNGLPRPHHPLLTSARFRAFSDDRFFLSVEAADPRFDPARTRELLERAGGRHVELVED